MTFLALFPPVGFVTLESAALTAVSILSSFSLAMLKILWDRSNKCEQWRDEKEPVIQDLSQKVGVLSVVAGLVHGCKTKDCQFSGKLETFSVKKKPTLAQQ